MLTMYLCEEEAGITYGEVGIDLRGYRSGKDYKTFCPRCHGSRKNKSDKSLSVEIETGQWHCWNPGCEWNARGSGLGIEGRERQRVNVGGVKQPQREASAKGLVGTMSGTVDGHPVSTQQSSTPAPAQPSRPLPSDVLGNEANGWLIDRGLSREAAEALGITSTEKDGKCVLHFPYLVNGELVNIKHRTLPKQFSQERGTMRSLFNVDNCQDATTVVIAEGELDVVALYMAGWKTSVTSPDGAGKSGGALAAFDEPVGNAVLANARWIVLAVDGDEPGQAYRAALIERFGADKCRVVEWPEGCKDANDVLLQHGSEYLGRLIERAQPAPLPGLRPLSAHRASLHELAAKGFAPGVTTGWPDFDFRWRPVEGEMVFVTGYPGDGKTSFTNNLLANLAYLNDWKIALYSPEQGGGAETLGNIVRITADAPYLPNYEKRVEGEALDHAIDWVGEHFFEVHADNEDGDGFASLNVPQILSIVEPAVLTQGIKLLMIDPWNELESSRPRHMSVEEYISTSLSTIRGWAKRNRVVVMIVIHPRKPESVKSMEKGPSAYEAAGAAHWNNKADVFLSVQRVREGENAGNCIVKVLKHRREGITGETGACEFQFVRDTGRFYCVGTVVSERVGANPYVDLPDFLRLEPRSEVVTVDPWQSSWDEDFA
jgi:twinkle protein